jgi:hypothetical protein
MGLVSYSYYKDTYLGEPVSADDFPRYEKRAEMLVLSVIHKTADQAAALPAVVLDAVMGAICAQIDYLYEYGVGVASYGKEAGGGFTVGKVSVHNGASSHADAGARSMIAPAVYVYLEQTGLLNPAVATSPEPWPALRGWF